MATDPISAALDQLAGHPRRDDLARLVRDARVRARDSGTRCIDGPALLEEAAKRGITRDDAETPLGNVLDVLVRGEGLLTASDQALLGALFVRGVSVDLAAGASQERELAEGVAWLVAEAVEAPPTRGATITSPSDADADAKASAESGPSVEPKSKVDAESQADTKAHGKESMPSTPTRTLHGEVVAAPRGPVATALLALSGFMLARGIVYLVGRFVLAFRRSAEVRLAQDGGLLLRTRTEMLHRALRERETIVPREALMRATREVRFPSLSMYAGLLALLVGSYLGVGLVVDGLRAASLSLLATGLLIVLVGLGLDFVLTSLLPGTRGRCRVLFVPRRGPALCIGEVEREDADRFLGELARR